MSNGYKITDKPYTAEKPDYIIKRIPVKSKCTGKEGYVIAKSYDGGEWWFITPKQFKRSEKNLCCEGDYLVIGDSDVDIIIVATNNDYYAFIKK